MAQEHATLVSQYTVATHERRTLIGAEARKIAALLNGICLAIGAGSSARSAVRHQESLRSRPALCPEAMDLVRNGMASQSCAPGFCVHPVADLQRSNASLTRARTCGGAFDACWRMSSIC